MLKVRQKIGKYRIEGRIGKGGFAVVYRAYDTIEGIRVALKIPHAHLLDDGVLDDFRNEVRVTARLDHPHILPLKNATFIGDRFVLVYPLGDRTLADRLRSRMSLRRTLNYTRQILSALAHAHDRRVIHCDVKPENFILFDDDRMRLADFGIAKVAHKTVRAAGTGTVGYCAPEQAMGKPSPRSDVFAFGLMLYRMLTGHLPEWPFTWPPPEAHRLQRRVHPDLVAFVRRCLEIEPRRRFSDAIVAEAAYRRLESKVLADASRRGRRRTDGDSGRRTGADWKTIRFRQFRRLHGRVLATRDVCRRCDGPVAETMICCPWCGDDRKIYRGDTRAPTQCPRCRRGMKHDWRYCAWCYGGGFEVETTREYADKDYRRACCNSKCDRKVQLPFMRYCPWCRHKVRKRWTIDGSRRRCEGCEWGILPEYWDFCPWCAKAVDRHARGRPSTGSR